MQKLTHRLAQGLEVARPGWEMRPVVYDLRSKGGPLLEHATKTAEGLKHRSVRVAAQWKRVVVNIGHYFTVELLLLLRHTSRPQTRLLALIKPCVQGDTVQHCWFLFPPPRFQGSYHLCVRNVTQQQSCTFRTSVKRVSQMHSTGVAFGGLCTAAKELVPTQHECCE